LQSSVRIQITQTQRTAGSTGRAAAWPKRDERQLWAVFTCDNAGFLRFEAIFPQRSICFIALFEDTGSSTVSSY